MVLEHNFHWANLEMDIKNHCAKAHVLAQ